MKIAVPYEDGILFEHFGRAKEFKVYAIDDLKPVEGEVVTPDDLSHVGVAKYLKGIGVDLVICGGIGDSAREAIENEHMLLFSGVTGGADDVIERFLEGTLDYGEGSSCDHHGEDHSCGGGCGGGCGGCHGCGGHDVSAEPYVETRTFTEIVTLTEENFMAEVLDDPGLIVIDFWAEWCQPCKMMAPTFDELNAEMPQVKFCKINCDEQPNLAAMFGIDSIPTLAVVQNRHTLTGMVGVHAKDELREMIERCKA